MQWLTNNGYMGNLNSVQHTVNVTWFQLATVQEKLGVILQTGE